MNMLKISKAIFRSLLSSRSLCVVVVALMVLCALPVFRSAAGIDGRVEYLESGITRVEQELSASYADALVNAGKDGVYTSSSSMPALLYPLAAGRLILAPLSPLLPFLQISDGEYTYYDGEFRFARIKAKRKRKGLGRVQMEDVLALTPKGDRSVYKYENDNSLACKDLTSGGSGTKIYELVFKGEKGINRYEFEPDEEMLDAVMVKYPRAVIK